MDAGATVGDAFAEVRARVDAAASRSGRRSSDVLLVAVTKHATPDQIRALIDLGHRDLGENRVQHLQQRHAQLAEHLHRRRTLGGETPEAEVNTPRWHMIGHLQRNKVKNVVPLVDLIHSVDSLRLADEIHNFGHRADRVIDVLLQVNASGESGKHGLSLPAVLPLAEQLQTMAHLRVRGLMTMAAYSDDPETARPAFARCAELLNDLRDSGYVDRSCRLLSMGMSGDFEVAIEEGANLVRIGSAIFGEGDEDEGGGGGDT